MGYSMSIALPSVERAAASDRTAPLGSRVAKLTLQERPTFESGELLQGKSEALIEHRGEMYRLRLTGSGKLYLTK
jgi:hemin uptake protein HemP